jgi:hypothetical protein
MTGWIWELSSRDFLDCIVQSGLLDKKATTLTAKACACGKQAQPNSTRCHRCATEYRLLYHRTRARERRRKNAKLRSAA